MNNRHNFESLIGKKYNMLTVIGETNQRNSSGGKYWCCKCDCGKYAIVSGQHLKSGHTKSCGCQLSHNFKHGKRQERLYGIWVGMKGRCNNPNNKAYCWYGGRGIKVCDEWSNNYLIFREWALNNGYSDSYSIDRIDVNGNYEPNNCRWTTEIEQKNNMSSNHYVVYNGKQYTIANLYREIKPSCSVQVFYRFLNKKGNTVDDLLNYLKENKYYTRGDDK